MLKTRKKYLPMVSKN